MSLIHSNKTRIMDSADAENVPVQALESLHIFPSLPRDIRQHIWKTAFDQIPPRILEIGTEDDENDVTIKFQGFSPFKDDPLLLACKESRKEFLHALRLCESVITVPIQEMNEKESLEFRFRPTRDTVYLGRQMGPWDSIPLEVREQFQSFHIHSLAMDVPTFLDVPEDFYNVYPVQYVKWPIVFAKHGNCTPRWASLQEVIVVADEDTGLIGPPWHFNTTYSSISEYLLWRSNRVIGLLNEVGTLRCYRGDVVRIIGHKVLTEQMLKEWKRDDGMGVEASRVIFYPETIELGAEYTWDDMKDCEENVDPDILPSRVN